MTDFDYGQLDSLSRFTEGLQSLALPSLAKFAGSTHLGFDHFIDDDDPNFSKSSTATVLHFLAEYGHWDDSSMPGEDEVADSGKHWSWVGTGSELAAAIVGSDWKSSGLKEGNPFTTAFLVEALLDLRDRVHVELDGQQEDCLKERVESLCREVLHERDSFAGDANGTAGVRAQDIGGVSIDKYTPTAFMTQKTLRVIQRWLRGSASDPDDPVRRMAERAISSARQWAWSRLHEESVAISARRPDADVFELGYAILCTCLTDSEATRASQAQRAIRDYALRQFFDAQLPDGTWPRSQPLFMYPKEGNAYCYEYEFLVQLLSEPQLQEQLLLQHLPSLDKSARSLDQSAVPIGRDGELGWASGHLIRVSQPESWTTASVYHYCGALHQLVAEAMRRSLFAYVGSTYRPRPTVIPEATLRDSFLDSPIQLEEGDPLSLKTVVTDNFLTPLAAEIGKIPAAGRLTCSRAAIFYGPPGTSKTTLAELVGEGLGWPVLKIDPSHLTRRGMQELHAETYRLFSMLEGAEGLVVLFDEFDELVRDRERTDNEASSRFLTTAMLPRLTALYGQRRLVYILATNHLELFDPAITRRGRFDLVVPVMPPTLEEKYRHWTDVRDHMVDLKLGTVASAHLGELTFDEFKTLRSTLLKQKTRAEAESLIAIHHRNCTMQQKAQAQSSESTWKSLVEEQRGRIRVEP